jgi:hypothetical protein
MERNDGLYFLHPVTELTVYTEWYTLFHILVTVHLGIILINN